MIPPAKGHAPTFDGQIQLYETPQAKGVTEWYKPEKRAIYINGQATSGQRHMESALAISLLQRGSVAGASPAAIARPWSASTSAT